MSEFQIKIQTFNIDTYYFFEIEKEHEFFGRTARTARTS